MSDFNTERPDSARRRLILSAPAALAVASISPTSLLHAAEDDSKREELIRQLSSETGLDIDYISSAIGQARFDESVIKRIKTPYESRTYAEYRPLFVHKQLAEKGEAYLEEHSAVFAKSSEKYGIQPQVVAAILGMETRYGAYKGKDRVLDALYTLATGYARRAGFFRGELGQFLLLCREEKRDPVSIKGSYAGAFGATQFIPSSYRGYAVDADGDGRRDVWDSPADIIGSVANYFHRFGWDSSRPVARWVDHLPYKPLTHSMLKKETREWRKLGDIRKELTLKLPEEWRDDDRVALIQRITDRGKRTALVHYNFHVITRWNRSYNYAMAITELAHMLGCPLCEVEA